LNEIYAGMVAGSFPVADGMDPLRTLRLLVQEVIDSTTIHFRFTVSEGTVFYLAVPSKLLASAPDFATPLAVALPNHPAHSGDAAYVLNLVGQSAAVIRRGKHFKLLTGYSDEVRDEVTNESLPIVEVDETQSVRLRSENWVYRTLTDKTARVTSFASLVAIGASLVIALGSSAVAGYHSRGKTSVTPESLVAEANAVIASARMSHPLAEQLQRVSAISAAVVRTGGWIDGYEYTKGGGETFTVSLPTWVTGDTIKDLGEGVVTELQAGTGNLIWARKANKDGSYVKGLGPAEIGTAPGARAADTPKAPPASAAAPNK
jgi:hypothetical protein